VPNKGHRGTLLVPPDSDFSLRQVAVALRRWDWRPPVEGAPPGETQPDRIEQDGEDGAVRVYFGDWCLWVVRTASGRGAARVVVVTDPEPEQLPRESFPSEDAYWDYLDSLPDYPGFFQSCLDGLAARFPEVVAFCHFGAADEVGRDGLWWIDSSRPPDAPVPLPTHLAGWLARATLTEQDTYFEAAVRCPCGSERVEVHYPGQTHQPSGRDSPIPCTVQLAGLTGYDAYWFGLKAVCAACRQECVVFDSKLHGWDAVVVCSAATKARAAVVPRTPLVPWACLDCGATAHTCTIHLRLQTPKQFLNDTFEDTGFPMPLSRWPDTFGWFGTSIRCCGCGRQTDDWVGYETR
jgi:hypothetical protein